MEIDTEEETTVTIHDKAMEILHDWIVEITENNQCPGTIFKILNHVPF